MKRKLLIYIPLVMFVSATLVLAVAVLNQTTDNKIEIPAVLLKPTPTVEVSPTVIPTIEPIPTVADPSVQIKNSLNYIMQDIGKVRVEDTRFTPPEFIFDMGI